jgi:hypothetical protein
MTAATVAAPANSIYFGNKIPNAGLCCTTYSHLWLTAETDENTDTVEFGYVPAGVVVVGMFVYSADIDTGSSALRQTFKIGSTSVKTADTIASTGGGEVLAFAPIATTAPTLVSVVTTTGANAHTNGLMYITVVYYSGQ